MATARQDSQLLPKNNKQSSVWVSGLSPSVSLRHMHMSFLFLKKTTTKTSLCFIAAPLVPSSLLPSASLTPASVGPDHCLSPLPVRKALCGCVCLHASSGNTSLKTCSTLLERWTGLFFQSVREDRRPPWCCDLTKQTVELGAVPPPAHSWDTRD